MKIKEAIQDFWKKFRLKHHSCTRNAKLIDSYTSSSGTPATGVGIWQTSVYKCEICGKIWDVN